MQVVSGRIVWSLAACLAMLWPVWTASGQAPTLSPDVMRVSGPFNGEQRQAVTAFTDHWTGDLTAADEMVVAEARGRLVEPLRSTANTESFKNQYSTIIASKLNAASTSPVKINRLNAMIVAGNLSGTDGLPILQAAIEDKEDSIRYLAAKGIAMAVARTQEIPAATAQQLVADIGKQLAIEESAAIREQLYLALAAVNNPESRAALIKAMDQHLGEYVEGGMSTGLRAEQKGFTRLYTGLLTAYLQNNAKDEEVRAFVVVSAKYVQMIAAQPVEGLADGELSPIVVDLVKVAEPMLNWGMQVFDANAPEGPKLEEPLRAGNNQQFQLNVLDWVDTLQKAKIQITAEELKLPGSVATTAGN